MLNYQIETVPSFVVLKPGGTAVAKSGQPVSLPHMQRVLGGLVQLASRHQQGS
jgi:hypothetical protein